MLFAIEEINNSTDLLPGISLGYKFYDDCVFIARGVTVALALANGNEVIFAPSEAPCSRPAQVQAILGGTFSSPCMAISTVIGPFNIPLVGNIDTNNMFLNRQHYLVHPCVKAKYAVKNCTVLLGVVYFIFLSWDIIYFLFLSDQPPCYLCLSQ